MTDTISSLFLKFQVSGSQTLYIDARQIESYISQGYGTRYGSVRLY